MFSLKEYDFIDMVRAIGKARYDVGIYCIIEEVFESDYIQHLLAENGVHCTTLESDHLRAILSKTSPLAEKKAVSLEDVLKHPLVIYNSSEDRCWHDLFLEKHHYQKRALRTNSITYLMSVVRDKGCAAFYLNRRRSVEKQIESDFVIRPIKEPVGVLTGVMWREDVEKPPELVDLLRCLDRVMAADRSEK